MATATSSIEIFAYFIIFATLAACAYIYFGDNADFELKCIVSGTDGDKYCVRERSRINEAVELLSKITNKCKELVDYVHSKYPEKENVARLYAGYRPNKIMEILPTSKYTAYSENKGEKLAFCLNKNSKDNADNNNLIDEHTLMFVAIHELSHIATKSIGHKSEFWENFKFLLQEAKLAGIHNPTDYKAPGQSKEYCGMKISDSPYFDIF